MSGLFPMSFFRSLAELRSAKISLRPDRMRIHCARAHDIYSGGELRPKERRDSLEPRECEQKFHSTQFIEFGSKSEPQSADTRPRLRYALARRSLFVGCVHSNVISLRSWEAVGKRNGGTMKAQ